MVKKNIFMWTSLGLICVLIVSTYLTAQYYMEFVKYQQLYNETLKELQKFDKYIFVNLLIDYGNGTKEWHNNTLIVRWADLLNATKMVADVDYITGEYGAFVTSINRVGGDPNTYWLWYTWNSTSLNWDFGPVASDAYVLREGEIVAWIYTRF
ncbi:hypothetical protein KEJ18_05925 [Candidatus Bathyarchaeota archaeon]|nr:hypothetical protein [Candidatus Bathyarchaeota archaeon]